MLTSTIVSKFIDILAHANMEENPNFMTVINESIVKTYNALNIEEAAPVCQSKVVFTPEATLTPAASTEAASKKKRGWPKGKPRKPKPASSMAVVAPEEGAAPDPTSTI